MEGQRIPPVIDGMKVFRLNHRLDGVDVSAQYASRETQGRVQVSPGRDVKLAAVQGVVKERGRNLAAGDPPQLAGALKLPEGERLEERLGRRVEGLDAAHRKAVRQTDAAEAAVQRIADKSGKPGGDLLEVLAELSIAHLLQLERVETRNRSRLTKLVEMIIALENGESRGNGPVKQVRFRKPEGVKPLEGPELGLHAERLPQAQEIVGGVVDADKVARNPADSARKADRVSSLLLHLHGDVDRALLLVLLDVVVFLLDRIKEAELVEAQGAVVPQRRAEELALVQQQLPPDHLVSGLGIPGKLDAMDKELLLFVEVQRQVDQELFVIALGIGGGHEVDVTELPVELLVVFEGLPHLREIENIAALHLQDGRELFLLEQLVAEDDELAQPVSGPLLQRNGEVHALAASPAPEKEGNPALGIGHLDLRLFHQGGEVSVVLVEAADLFQVVIDLILVVRLVEPVEPRRRAEGLRVLHGALQREIGKHRVALKANVAHLDLGAFHDDKGQSHRVRRDVPRAGAHAGELPAVFRQELLEDNFGALDHDGVILGLN